MQAKACLIEESETVDHPDYAKRERQEFIRRTLMEIDLELALETIEKDASDVLHILQGSKHWWARIMVRRIQRKAEQLIVARNQIVEKYCRD